jgi:hypothetical protein
MTYLLSRLIVFVVLALVSLAANAQVTLVASPRPLCRRRSRLGAAGAKP